jgi:hypothetical protein
VAVPVATLVNRPGWKTRLDKLTPGWLRREWNKRRRLLSRVGAVLLAAILIYGLVLLTRPAPVGWLALDPVQFTSEGGATLTKLPDRSILASGKVAPADTYTITAYTDREGINAIRLEVLPDPSLPGQGPGRHASSGNFVLSELRLLAAPRSDPSKTEPVVLVNATADQNQENWVATSAVDGQSETGWAILPKVGERHWAVFETKSRSASPAAPCSSSFSTRSIPKPRSAGCACR